MAALLIMDGIIGAIVLGVYNEKWYTKLAGIAGGLLMAILGLIIVYLANTK